MSDVSRRKLSVQEAAKAAGVSSRTVHRWVAQGRMPASRAGRSLHVDPLDVDRVASKRGPGGRLLRRRTAS